MKLYALAVQQAAALRQYETCRDILDQELGALPKAETTALYEAIKNWRFPAVFVAPSTRDMAGSRPGPAPRTRKEYDAPAPFHNLPAYPSPFVGRDTELTDLKRLLVDDPECRLLTVTGPGGIGKTRLAVEAARRTLPAFGAGVYFVPLGSHTPAQHIAAAIGEPIGLRFHEDGTPRAQLLHHLSDKHMLLVLDNLEYLLPSVALISEILQAAPQVKILVTSRERLNLGGESVHNLREMPYPAAETTQALLGYGAVQLLIQYARLARPHLILVREDFFAAAGVARLVEGMPLALVLAAGWLEVLSFSEIADEIAHNLDFLEGQSNDLPERQRSVRAAFDYSWRRLTAPEQQTYMRLSVFRGGCTRQAAQRVAGAGLRTLRRLVDKSFISFGQGGRYRMHELLRQFAAEQLQAAGEAACILLWRVERSGQAEPLCARESGTGPSNGDPGPGTLQLARFGFERLVQW